MKQQQLSFFDAPATVSAPPARKTQKQQKPKPPSRTSPQYARYPGVIAELKDGEHPAATINVQRLGNGNPTIATIYFSSKRACADFILSAMPEWDSVALFVRSDRPSKHLSAHPTETDMIGSTSADLRIWAENFRKTE